MWSLCTAPFLLYLWPGEKFIVDIDASNMEIGGMLSQVEVVWKRSSLLQQDPV
jgi:hypothetical protein